MLLRQRTALISELLDWKRWPSSRGSLSLEASHNALLRILPPYFTPSYFASLLSYLFFIFTSLLFYLPFILPPSYFISFLFYLLFILPPSCFTYFYRTQNISLSSSVTIDNNEEIHRITNTALELFRRVLITTCTLRRQRKSISDFLENVEALDENSTPRLFLEAGKTATFAYYLVCKRTEGSAHYQGKNRDLATIQEFHTLSVEDRKRVAKEVGAVVPDATVEAAMNKWLTADNAGRSLYTHPNKF